MPAAEALFPVALHCPRSHGDDGDPDAALPRLAAPDTPCGLEAVHLGHLAVHQHEVVGDAPEGSERLVPVPGDVGPAAQLLEDLDGDELVDGIVLHDEYPRPAHGRSGCRARFRASRACEPTARPKAGASSA